MVTMTHATDDWINEPAEPSCARGFPRRMSGWNALGASNEKRVSENAFLCCGLSTATVSAQLRAIVPKTPAQPSCPTVRFREDQRFTYRLDSQIECRQPPVSGVGNQPHRRLTCGGMRLRTLCVGTVAAVTALVAAALVGVPAGTGQTHETATAGHVVARQVILGPEGTTQFYPFMASLQDPNGMHGCGGSLITPQWIVTAGHCVSDPNGGVRSADFFRIRIGSPDRFAGSSLVGASNVVLHPGFDPESLDFDIALIRLDQPVPQAPIAIADNSPTPGTRVRLMGWGQTCSQQACGGRFPRYLKQLDTSVVPDARCTTETNALGQLCVAVTPRNTACYGDSGGPAVVAERGHLALVGATSRGGGESSTCGADWSAIYTDVTAYRRWIISAIT